MPTSSGRKLDTVRRARDDLFSFVLIVLLFSSPDGLQIPARSVPENGILADIAAHF